MLDIIVDVKTTFNDSGTDVLNIGIPALHTYWVNKLDVSSALFLEPAAIPNTWGYIGAVGGVEMFAYYEGENDDAGAGQAKIAVLYTMIT